MKRFKRLGIIVALTSATTIFNLKMIEAKAASDVSIGYSAHVQNIGDKQRVYDGQLMGTEGRSLRLEGINIALINPISGMSIKYRVHIQNIGWTNWLSSNQYAGTKGQSLRVEAVEIKLEGAPSNYHVEYQAHVQDIGWQSWVKDGQIAGTTGQSKRIEALKIRIVKDEQPNNGGSNISYVYTNYNISLNDMVNIQLSREPALQMVNSNNQWEWRYAKITSDKQGYYYYPSANVTTFVEDANVYNIIKDQLILNLDSSLSRNTDTYKYQFLKLSYVEGTTAQQLNSLFRPDGVLSGKGQVFIDAAKKYNVNPIYLASHAILETGNGTSPLAKGIDVNGVKVYNLFGIGAIDSNPDGAGSQYAYSKGWTSIDLAIYGGAEFTSSSYINSSYKQDTIYKMRWNPDRPGVHQYATDVKWATNQVANIKKMFDQIPDAKLVFDIPVYK